MQELTQKLLAWYKENARVLPWRTDYEPYHVLISELMLQQTQMERGVEYFKRWIERFPTIQHVAHASEEEILHAWEGLGYYRRARYVHEMAKNICDEYGGIIPSDKEILKTFKGLGDYTIAALCSIAFNQPIATIDANVERVFSRLFCIQGDTKKYPAKNEINTKVYEFFPKDNARLFNQALMELGALICRKKPLCALCPINDFCLAHKENRQSEFPNPKTKQTILNEHWIELIFVTSDNKIAVKQREKSSHWGGLFEFYPLQISPNEVNTIVSQTCNELELYMLSSKFCVTIPYTYTNHRNTLAFYIINLKEDGEKIANALPLHTCVSVESFKSLAFPSPHRKAISKIFK